MSDDTGTTDTLTDDDAITEISDATIEALRKLAIEEGNVRVVELCNEALAPRIHPITEEAARKRREVREQCAEEWAEYAARSGIIVAPPPRITDEQISRLRRIAELEGDTVLVSVCNRAPRSTEARRACEVAWRARKLTPVLLAVAFVATLALLLASAGCGEVEAIGDLAVPVPFVDVEGEP